MSSACLCPRCINHHMPLITRRPETIQTTPNVMARPILEEFSEVMLGFGVEVEEDWDDVEEVDDDDDDDGMSFTSRAVYTKVSKIARG